MIKAIRKVYSLFSKQSRRQLVLLVLLSSLSGLFEIASLSAMMPFVMLSANPEIATQSHTIKWIAEFLHLETFQEILIFFTVFSIFILVIANAFSALITRLQLRFTHIHGHKISYNLLKNYLSQSYLFFVDKNSSELSKNVLSEVNRVILGVLLPFLQMMTKSVMVLAITLFLLYQEPLLTGLTILFLCTIYILTYFLLKRRLSIYGWQHTLFNQQRYKLVDELFSGIKMLKLSTQADMMVKEFEKPSEGLAQCDIKSQLIPQLIRYLLEAFVYGGILSIALILTLRAGNINESLPILALFAFAGYRLMPALQQIFACATNIQYHVRSIDLVHEAMSNLPKISYSTTIPFKFPRTFEALELKNISYCYPTSTSLTLEDISMSFPAKQCIGIVGSTGAGKTTLLDIVLGLLPPNKGVVMVDDIVIDPLSPAWHEHIGYVPQDIFLIDDDIIHNIALGESDDKINHASIIEACRIAKIHDFIESLPEKYDTQIGEKGIKLSGGQRQRLGIARALYKKPEILVLDEATSALDSTTELQFLTALKQDAASNVIIMVAHRLASIKHCDVIYYLNEGKIEAYGSYHELKQTSHRFAELTSQQATA